MFHIFLVSTRFCRPCFTCRDYSHQVFPMGGRGGRTSNFYWRDEKPDTSKPAPATANSPAGKTTDNMPRTPAHAGLSPVPAPGLDADHFSLSPSPVTDEATPKLTRGASGQSRRSATSSPNPMLNGSNGGHEGSWERRRGISRMDGGGVLSRIHDLADHLRNNVRRWLNRQMLQVHNMCDTIGVCRTTFSLIFSDHRSSAPRLGMYTTLVPGMCFTFMFDVCLGQGLFIRFRFIFFSHLLGEV